jgi:subtilisin family serine protease
VTTRTSRAALLAAIVALLVGIAGSGSAQAGERVPRGLRARAQREGSVRVIARLAVPAAPAAQSGDGSAEASRRRAIRAVQEGVGRDLAGTSWREAHAFATVPYVALEVTDEGLDRLEASGHVLAVGEDRLERPLLTESVPLVQADQAWAEGNDGTGWTVAMIDTGVAADHPFLAGKVVSEACYSANGSCPNGQRSQFGEGAGRPCDWAEKACAHGTHVAGILAGVGETVSGVAPGANLIAIQVFSRFSGSTCDDDVEDPCALTFTSDTIAALERVYALRDTFRIAAVNMSLGGGKFRSEPSCDLEDAARKEVVDNLRAVGIATIAAAGNEGDADGMSAPACLSSVISVGATTKSDEVASFSNSAPFLDLLAPGVSIVSSVPPARFAMISGTSQAVPHVSAAFAIIDQRLGRSAVDEVFEALRSTGLPLFDPKSGVTTPRIQIRAALDRFPVAARSSGLQITPDGLRTLVNKDVNGERWAITLNEDDTVTGNVFPIDGGAPQFVWCEFLGDDGNPDPYAVAMRFSCSGAGNCTSLACPAGQWSPIAEVTLPGSFFLPPLPAASPSSAAATSAAMTVERVAQSSPSALQITPDGRRTLVSKDVGGERWAITRNDDRSVSGNVFTTDGADPKFVWCEYVSETGSPDPLVTYDCLGADRCNASPCTTEQWSFLSRVTLPSSFFLP